METKYHKIKNISFDGYFMNVNIDNQVYRLDLRKHSKKLADSSLEVKNNYRVSPSGYGIHWEDIDEDLSVDGILKSLSPDKNQLKEKSIRKSRGRNVMNATKVSDKKVRYKGK